MTMPISERLRNNSKFNPASGCIEWQGTKVNGYGRVMCGSRSNETRKTFSAHRLSYEINNGPILIGLFVCHRCDNPSCINPDHLFIGSRQDNVDDRQKKGRNKPRSILSYSDVLMIRERNRENTMELAKEFGISRRAIQDILNFTTWPAAPKGETK